ncbi:MAG: metallophosphoesterase family protein [bacterium]
MAKNNNREKLDEVIDNLKPKEVKTLLQQLEAPDATKKTFNHRFSGKHTKIGVISDLHIGAKSFDEDFFHLAMKEFKRQGVEAIYCPGDILEGMSGRPGHIYELDQIGYEAQASKASQLIDEAPTKIYGITGNHDQWFQKKGDAGVDVGKDLEHRTKNFVNLGMNEADVKLSPAVTMKLFHAGDGSAYATSYKLQKLIESFTGGDKPNIVLSGHYHKALYTFVRNVHGYECGTLCDQTEWMRGKKIPAHKGFWIIDVYKNKSGVEKTVNEFFPGYE